MLEMFLDSLDIVISVVEMGLIYSLVVIGVYLTSNVIKFDDLSVEGSFGLGGALVARSSILGITLWSSFPLAIIFGGMAGLATGLLNTKLKINNLVSGLIVTTALFSINKKLASSSMITLPDEKTIFYFFETSIGFLGKFLFLITISFIALFFLKWFLKTEVGFMIRAVGCNPQMLANLGKSAGFYKIIGLMISNGLTALAGALFVNYTTFFSVTGSIGTLVYALAGLMLGEAISDKLGVSVIFGAIAYPALYAITIELQLDSDLTKLIIAVLMVFLLLFKRHKNSVVVWG